MTDSKFPPTPKVAFFWAQNLQPYHANFIIQCFNLGDYFKPHFCHEVNEMHLHILAIGAV